MCPLHLQRWQRQWPLPRWQARFHQPLWRQLAQHWLRRLPQQLWQWHQQRLRALRLGLPLRHSIALALLDCPMLQRHCPKLPWPLSLLRLPWWLRLRPWQRQWPSWPLSHRSLFHWLQQQPLRRWLLHLQLWQHRWQLSRCRAQLHQPLWQQLAQHWLQRLPQQPWLWHRQRLRVQPLGLPPRRSTALALPDCPVLQRHHPKLPWPLSLRQLLLLLRLPHWRLL
jgi:hypothetical protein